MKTYKLLRYVGILFIVGSIIGFPFTNNPEIKFGCCLFTVLGIYALATSSINKQKFFPNE